MVLEHLINNQWWEIQLEETICLSRFLYYYYQLCSSPNIFYRSDFRIKVKQTDCPKSFLDELITSLSEHWINYWNVCRHCVSTSFAVVVVGVAFQTRSPSPSLALPGLECTTYLVPASLRFAEVLTLSLPSAGNSWCESPCLWKDREDPWGWTLVSICQCVHVQGTNTHTCEHRDTIKIKETSRVCGFYSPHCKDKTISRYRHKFQFTTKTSFTFI